MDHSEGGSSNANHNLFSLDNADIIAARLGGDEFAIMLAGGMAGQARQIALAVLATFATSIELIPQISVRVGASIGIATAEAGSGKIDQLFGQADSALYDMKNAGGGGVRYYSEAEPSGSKKPVMPFSISDEPLAVALGYALNTDELYLAYQPIRSCLSGEVISVEVLARWESPRFGVVPPSQFIPIAEKSGLIVRFGEWVLQHAMVEAMKVAGSFSLSINLSPVQIETSNIVKAVVTAIQATRFDPQRLVLEITEGVLLSPTPRTLQKLRHLRALGIRLSLDDFGTGYANISTLDEIHFDIVKFDRSIIQANPSRRESVLKGMIEVVKAFDLPTVIEGIETPDQWHLASRLGASSGQGYLLGRPQREIHKAACALTAINAGINHRFA